MHANFLSPFPELVSPVSIYYYVSYKIFYLVYIDFHLYHYNITYM